MKPDFSCRKFLGFFASVAFLFVAGRNAVAGSLPQILVEPDKSVFSLGRMKDVAFLQEDLNASNSVVNMKANKSELSISTTASCPSLSAVAYAGIYAKTDKMHRKYLLQDTFKVSDKKELIIVGYGMTDDRVLLKYRKLGEKLLAAQYQDGGFSDYVSIFQEYGSVSGEYRYMKMSEDLANVEKGLGLSEYEMTSLLLAGDYRRIDFFGHGVGGWKVIPADVVYGAPEIGEIIGGAMRGTIYYGLTNSLNPLNTTNMKEFYSYACESSKPYFSELGSRSSWNFSQKLAKQGNWKVYGNTQYTIPLYQRGTVGEWTVDFTGMLKNPILNSLKAADNWKEYVTCDSKGICSIGHVLDDAKLKLNQTTYDAVSSSYTYMDAVLPDALLLTVNAVGKEMR